MASSISASFSVKELCNNIARKIQSEIEASTIFVISVYLICLLMWKVCM